MLLAMKTAVILMLTICSAVAQTASRKSSADQPIRHVLDDQAAAWNRGDLEGFLRGYWRSPELTFYSGGAVTSGWDATLERYRARYQSGGREMGKLTFSELEIHLLSAEAAWVGGHWRLEMKNGDQPGGLFTLVFRNFPEGWRIVHDHTSEESQK